MVRAKRYGKSIKKRPAARDISATELDDLAKSATDSARSLTIWIQNSRSISPRGSQKVNASFSEYFALRFGGGGARLTLEESDGWSQSDDNPSPKLETRKIYKKKRSVLG